MKFFTLLLLLGALSLVESLSSPDAEAEAISIPDSAPGIHLERDLEDAMLQKRACVRNGCKCRAGAGPGQYCYACDMILSAGNTSTFDSPFNGWVFECNPAGGCCTYGSRMSCSGGKPSPCGAT